MIGAPEAAAAVHLEVAVVLRAEEAGDLLVWCPHIRGLLMSGQE